MNSEELKEKIIVALDFDCIEEAIKFIKSFDNRPIWFKVGLEFFCKFGLQGVQRIKDVSGSNIFLDLKFHDISNTVKGAISSVMSLEPDMINFHIAGGRKMMTEAVSHIKAISAEKNIKCPLIIGVSILTSLDDNDIAEVGYKNNVEDNVITMAKLGQSCGLDGIVCSPHEIVKIKDECGSDFVTVVPGIQIEMRDDDQKRCKTFKEAVNDGTNYAVIGRPIRLSENPQETFNKLINNV